MGWALLRSICNHFRRILTRNCCTEIHVCDTQSLKFTAQIQVHILYPFTSLPDSPRYFFFFYTLLASYICCSNCYLSLSGYLQCVFLWSIPPPLTCFLKHRFFFSIKRWGERVYGPGSYYPFTIIFRIRCYRSPISSIYSHCSPPSWFYMDRAASRCLSYLCGIVWCVIWVMCLGWRLSDWRGIVWCGIWVMCLVWRLSDWRGHIYGHIVRIL